MNDLIGARTSDRGSDVALVEAGGETQIGSAANKLQEASIDSNALPSILRVQRDYAPPRITVASQMIMSGP